MQLVCKSQNKKFMLLIVLTESLKLAKSTWQYFVEFDSRLKAPINILMDALPAFSKMAVCTNWLYFFCFLSKGGFYHLIP